MLKAIGISLLALGALGFAANAEPVKLSKAQLDQITAGSQQATPPGQFPAGNPAKSPGKSNCTGGGTCK
jgi:hypothetical protein